MESKYLKVEDKKQSCLNKHCFLQNKKEDEKSMKFKKIMATVIAVAATAAVLAGCSEKPSDTPAANAAAIVTQPQSIAAAQGDEVKLTVEATGSELTYQWYQNADPVNRTSDDIQIIGSEGTFIPPRSSGTPIEGASESEFIAPTETAGVQSYYVEVKSGDETLVSDAATVAVKGETAAQTEDDKLNIVFICGGNTGRSAMAKVIAEEIFAEKGIPVVISSAGSDIIDGDPAEENAAILMAERGLDLSEHVAAWWTPEMLQNADYVFVMTESHKNRVNVATMGIYEEKIYLLREFVGDSGSVPDPYEEPMEKYVETADLLTDAIGKIADIVAAK